MFIIDFDDTLYNVHDFKTARQTALFKCDVPYEVYQSTYKQARNDETGNTVYTNERHAQYLAQAGFSGSKIDAALQETISHSAMQKFLFPDAIPFLDFLKHYQEPMILLSLGEATWQKKKIDAMEIGHYFDKTIMVEDSKETVLAELQPLGKGETAWFINDKVAETVPLAKKFSWLRPVLKQTPAIISREYEESGLPFFKTLTEIQTYISKHYGRY